MFIGHYAVPVAPKKTEPQTSLGVPFIAVQLAAFMIFPLAEVSLPGVG